MATLYVVEPGARIEKEYQRILVTKQDEVIQAIPIRLIDEVVLVGYAGATTPAMISLLDQGSGLSLVTRTGRLRGRLRAVQAPNLGLRKAQYAAAQDHQLKVTIIKSILRGKLKNSRVMAMRILRSLEKRSENSSSDLVPQIIRIENALKAIDDNDDEDVLRGLEGSAANAYFNVLKSGIKWQGDGAFIKRTKRPPRDPVNVLLSFGYTLCGDALFTACEVVGLDPYCGFFHAEKYGRPALALDLVEEFRSIIVDSVVLTLINKKMIKTTDFEFDDGIGGRVILKNKGQKIFLNEFVRRLNTSINHPFIGKSITYRKCFEIQARQIRKMIEGTQQEYIPLTVR